MKKTLAMAMLALVAVTACTKEEAATTVDMQGTYQTVTTAFYNPATMYTSFHTTTNKDSIENVAKKYHDSMFVFTATAAYRFPYKVKFEGDTKAQLTLFNKVVDATVTRSDNDLLFSYQDTVKVPIVTPGTAYVYKLFTPEMLFDSIAKQTLVTGTITGLKDSIVGLTFRLKAENGKLYLPLLTTCNQMTKRDNTGTVMFTSISSGKLYGVEFNNAAIKPLESEHIVILQSGRVEMVKQ